MIERERWILKKRPERKMSSGQFGLPEILHGGEVWFGLVWFDLT